MEESVPRISQDNAVANKHQETQIEKKRKLVSERERERAKLRSLEEEMSIWPKRKQQLNETVG